jgi:hypothetical protein
MEGILQTLFLLFALTLSLAYLAPQETILGYSYKLIYLHLPLLYVSLISLSLCGVFSLASLRDERFYRRSFNAGVLGVAFGVGTLITTAAFMTMAWGGIAFSEPRLRALLITYGLFFVYLGVHRLNRREVTALYVIIATLLALSTYYCLVYQTTFQLHPQGVSMPLKMKLPLYSSLAGFLVLYYYLFEKMEKR